MTDKIDAEAAACRYWRKRVMLLSRAELAAISGYSVATIATFEQGHNPQGKPLSPGARRRYRLICAAIDAGLHRAAS
jgi:hypothetical protein